MTKFYSDEATEKRINELPVSVPVERNVLIRMKTLDENYFGELKYQSNDYRVFLTDDMHPVLVQKRVDGNWLDYLTFDQAGRYHYAY